ncbi:ATP-binding protein [Desulfosporosinus sp. OT]|uniref:ATP-binding protein n=1 Tax=Desulfosporosinus sp. OT TaxID=913865 RepID=UPI000223B2EA|nr:ATP-binding protein [Desulfosporosinus sp. OT]EGW36055.1 histidine kinase-, DNA gyrase B-, and HSP90-like ATPase family protein [Desulfosporosinus sp. OT]
MFRRQAYYYASAVFLLLLVVYSVAINKQPYVGLELESVNGQWIVTSSDSDGQGYKSGVRVGDLILKINQDDPGKNSSIQIWSEAEGASTLEVRRSDQSTAQLINIPELPFSRRTLSDIPFAILGFVFWFLGFMSWFRRPFLVQARALFWLNWVISLAFVLAPASSRDLILARELEYIIFSAVPIFLINFISSYSNENLNRVNFLGRLMLTLMSVIILIVTVLQSVGIVHLISPLRKLVLVTVSIGVLFTLWNLGALLKLPKDKPEKNQSNILLMGIAIGFLPFVLLTAIPIISGFQPIMNAHVSSLFVSLIPATWYYVIAHKYLPDSRRLLRITIAFFFEGIFSGFVVTYLLFFLKILKSLNLEVTLAVFSLIMLVMVSFRLLRLIMVKLLKKFGWLSVEQDLDQKVLKLNERLALLHEEELILEEVIKSLGVEGAFLVAQNDEGGYLKKAAGRFLEKHDDQSRLETYFQADRKINLGAKKLPKGFPAELYILLDSNDFDCGLFIGHRYSRIEFQREELPLITLIFSQVAQRLITEFVIKELSQEIKEIAQRSLINQRKIQRLQGITGSLFKSIEQERKSIARDLHDGSLQLALDLNRWLDDIAEECPSAKDGKAIAHMREVVENLNFELRSICSDLRPPSLNDLGLLYAIQIMCEEKMENESLLISLETVGISEGVRLKEQVELAAYRFLQEGITNAVKHSGSSKINIYIELNDSELELSIRDFGNGFDISKIDDWSLKNEHFGLIGMKERFQGIGGELQINSIIHQGTILKASIPR